MTLAALKKGCFSNCTSLYSLTIPASVEAVQSSVLTGCESLEELEVGCSQSILPKSFFYGLKRLAYVALPLDTAKVVIKNAKRLAIGMPAKQTVICICKDAIIIISDEGASSGGAAPEETVFKYSNGKTIKKNVTGTLGLDDIANRDELTYVKVGNLVTAIAAGAFEGCRKLVTLTLPSSVKKINYMAFSGCSSLLALELPSALTTLGSFSFSYCSSLIQLTVNGNANSFSTGCFSQCPALTEVTFMENTVA